MELVLMLAIVGLWLISLIACIAIGARKGSPIGAAVLGLVLGPLGLLLVALSGAANRRPCPLCGESVLRVAVVCSHCGRDIPAE
jgi:hypothetical protein